MLPLRSSGHSWTGNRSVFSQSKLTHHQAIRNHSRCSERMPFRPSAATGGCPSEEFAVAPAGRLSLSSAVLAIHVASTAKQTVASAQTNFHGPLVAVSTVDRHCRLWSPGAGCFADDSSESSDGSLLLLRGGSTDRRRPIFCFLSAGKGLESNGGLLLLAGAYEKEVVAWEITPGAGPQPVTATELSVNMSNHTGWVRSIAATQHPLVGDGGHDGILFSCACNFIKVWRMDLGSSGQLPAFPHAGDLQIFRGDILALCCHGDTLYAASADGKLYSWGVLPSSPLGHWESLCQPHAHDGRIFSLTASSSWLFSAAIDGRVKIWAHSSPGTSQPSAAVQEISISAQGHAPVVCVLPAQPTDPTEDHTAILTGSDEGEVAVWHIKDSGEAVKTQQLPDMPGAVKAIHCAPAGPAGPGGGAGWVVAIGDDAGTVQMHTLSRTLQRS